MSLSFYTYLYIFFAQTQWPRSPFAIAPLLLLLSYTILLHPPILHHE